MPIYHSDRWISALPSLSYKTSHLISLLSLCHYFSSIKIFLLLVDETYPLPLMLLLSYYYYYAHFTSFSFLWTLNTLSLPHFFFFSFYFRPIHFIILLWVIYINPLRTFFFSLLSNHPSTIKTPIYIYIYCFGNSLPALAE